MTILNPWEWLAYHGGGSGLCDVYLFNSANIDSLQLGLPFTGNLKVIIAATAEDGLNTDIIAGMQDSFVASTDLLNDPQWVQYEISSVSITYLVDNTFTGRIKYAKNDAWYNLDMGNVINADGDIVQNVVNESWKKGVCPPEWVYNLVATTPLTSETEMGAFN